MNKERFLIAGGNTTLLIEGCEEARRIDVAQEAIGNDEAEQVGFITLVPDPTLETMGNELCINGTIAFAKRLGRAGRLKASGFKGEAEYKNTGDGFTQITFDLDYQREGDIVLFDGIGYLCSKNPLSAVESTLWELSRRYNKPAFGLAIYRNSDYRPRLEPIVYVEKVRTCVVETACGSGSLALNIVTGENEITQRTGQSIYVYRSDDRFTVSAEVVKIGEKR